MTTYRKTKRAFERQHINQNLGHGVHDDTRTLEQKASDSALMKIRGQINDALSVKDSHVFVAEMTDARNRWDVINKWLPLAEFITTLGKARAHSQISMFKVTKTKVAATEAGWTVERVGFLQYRVEWIEQHLDKEN